MSERTTAEIVADHPRCGHHGSKLEPGTDGMWCRDCFPEKFPGRKAADRLAELDATINGWDAVHSRFLDELRATLPNCPTCGGTGYTTEGIVTNGVRSWLVGDRCPDCRDTPGKVSIERLVKLWEAVHGDDPRIDATVYAHSLIDHLRAIR